jgi:hypothetical protein
VNYVYFFSKCVVRYFEYLVDFDGHSFHCTAEIYFSFYFATYSPHWKIFEIKL